MLNNLTMSSNVSIILTEQMIYERFELCQLTNFYSSICQFYMNMSKLNVFTYIVKQKKINILDGLPIIER